MKKILLTATILGVAAMSIMGKAKDPVVMTIDGRDVKLSEFEYLYNKNNNQQLTPLTFDEYVDMFVNYKLKVADALNAQLDTTAAFKAEFDKFRHELAQPYLNDKNVEQQLVQDAYSHTADEVYVSHIMLGGQDPATKQRLDSIRQEILSGNITFEDAARQYSVDRASSTRGGRMAWVTGLSQYPWAFEKACYDTPVGMISEVVNSGIGFHLIRPEERRPTRGEVLAEHILVLTRGLDEAGVAAAKAKIDSIYRVVNTPGVNFGDVARAESQDPGSANDGGSLGWFGSGKMVAAFDSIAFALPDGGISEPFATQFGYHIIHKVDHRGQRPLDELRPEIEHAIQGDNRAQMPLRATLDNVANETKSSIHPEYIEAIKAIMSDNEDCDTTVIRMIKECDAVAFTAPGGRTYTVREALAKTPLRPNISPMAMQQSVERAINNAYDAKLIDYKITQLEATEPAYSNLVNEYRDGILLFDISNANVWDRAAKDTEGLNAYFKANRDKYCTWTAPKYKAYIIFAQNDSTLNEIKSYLNANYPGQKVSTIDQEAFTSDIKTKFGRNAKVERVIAAQGDNPITDYLGFGADKPENKNQTWTCYTAYGEEIIDQPEEVSDAKGVIVADYQSELEREWLNKLHKKYDVKIDKKNLNKARAK